MPAFSSSAVWAVPGLLVLAGLIAHARWENGRAKSAWREVWAAFAEKYPERKILRNWRLPPQTDAAGRRVFCIVWASGTIPPARTWWTKHAAEPAFEEISETEAAKRITVSEWR